MTTRILPPLWTVFDSNGDPVSGAKVYFYVTGSTTPKNTYSDSALSATNTNPIICDGSGRIGEVFGTGAYKLVVNTADDTLIGTYDPVVLATGTFLPLSGGTMSGAVDMGGQNINNLPTPSGSANPATKGYVDGLFTTGTITPTVSGGLLSPTYNEQRGNYLRIGDWIWVNFHVDVASATVSGTGATAVVVGGLPAAPTNAVRGVPLFTHKVPFSNEGPLLGLIGTGSSSIRAFSLRTNNTSVELSASQFGSGGAVVTDVSFSSSFVYYVGS